jgi:hypothetical protein
MSDLHHSLSQVESYPFPARILSVRTRKRPLVCGLEDLDFFHCELLCTREECFIALAGRACVFIVEAISVTVGICAAAVENRKATTAKF